MMVRLLLAALVCLAIPGQALGGPCVETFYSHTVVKPAGWEVYLTNGSVLTLYGGDAVFPTDWTPGDETGVCKDDGLPVVFEITDLVLRQTVSAYPKGTDPYP
jgi:hypothetical protein